MNIKLIKSLGLMGLITLNGLVLAQDTNRPFIFGTRFDQTQIGQAIAKAQKVTDRRKDMSVESLDFTSTGTGEISNLFSSEAGYTGAVAVPTTDPLKEAALLLEGAEAVKKLSEINLAEAQQVKTAAYKQAQAISEAATQEANVRLKRADELIDQTKTEVINSYRKDLEKDLGFSDAQTSVESDQKETPWFESICTGAIANRESIFGIAYALNGVKRLYNAYYNPEKGGKETYNGSLGLLSIIAAISSTANYNPYPELTCGIQAIAALDILLSRFSNPVSVSKKICHTCGTPNVCKCPAKESWLHKLETVGRAAIALPALYLIANKLSQAL